MYILYLKIERAKISFYLLFYLIHLYNFNKTIKIKLFKNLIIYNI